VEHNVGDVKKKVSEPKSDIESREESDYNGDDAYGVKCDDNEDKRVTALNDGFEVDPTQWTSNNKLKMVVIHAPVEHSEPETKVEDHDYFS
jgi:hypothetical protein